MKGKHETPDQLQFGPNTLDEELTNIFQPLEQFIESNSGMVSVGIAAMSGQKWQVPFTIWRAGLKAVTAPMKLVASLSRIAWRNNVGSRAVRFIFNGLAIAVKSIGHKKIPNPKADSGKEPLSWREQIEKIREQKKQAQADKAKIQAELNINTGRIDKILASVDRKWKESWARAAVKWVQGKGGEWIEPQILETRVVKTILDAGPEKVLANKAFQKLVTNPKLIEALEKNAPVIAKVIHRILEETLSKEAKLIRNITYALRDKDKPADEEKKTTEPVNAAQMVKSAAETLVQFKENGGLKALSAIITSSNKPIADYLSKEGEAHLKTVLSYFNLTLDKPNIGTQLVAELGTTALKVIDSEEFNLNKLGQNIALLLSEEPEGKAKSTSDKKDPKVDVIPIVGDTLNIMLPLVRTCMPLINTPEAAEWAKTAIVSNAEPIASLLESVLIKHAEQIKKEQAEEKALKESSSKSKAADTPALDDKTVATQPPSVAPFFQETIRAFASTLITADQTAEDGKTIPGNLGKITTVLEKVSIILSDSKAVSMKEKISATLEIGEIACQILESPAMLGLLTKQLKEHEAALVSMLDPLIGKHIHPAKLIAILSNEKNITKLIQSVRELKQDVKENRTNLGSYWDIATALLKSKIVRKLAVAVVTQEAANKLAKVGVVIDELVAGVKKAAKSFATDAKKLFHAATSHPFEKTHGQMQDNSTAAKEVPEQETKVHTGDKKEDLADKLSSKAKEVKAELGNKVDEAIDKAKELKAELAHKAKDFFKINQKHQTNAMKTTEADKEKKPNKIQLPNPFSKKSKESSADKSSEEKKHKPGIFVQIGKKLKGVKEETCNNPSTKFSADKHLNGTANKPEPPEINI